MAFNPNENMAAPVSPRSYLRIARGRNNGIVYISRREGLWHSEFGTEANWFELHYDRMSMAIKIFAGWVDN